MKKQTIEEAADNYVFITNGHKFSNNDNTAGDNYKSFIDGANWYKENNFNYDENFIQWLNRSVYCFCSKNYWFNTDNLFDEKDYTLSDLYKIYIEKTK